MTITEAPPEAAEAPAETADAPAAPAPTGLYKLVTTGDHKIIGAAYTWVSLAFGIALAIVSLVVAIERTDTGTIDLYNSFDQLVQSWQAYAVGGVFLLVVPLFVGIAISIVPLQVGSPAIAFPRATAASFWGWLIGSGLLLASFIADGGFGTPAGVGDPEPTVLSIVSLGLVLVSLGLASVCLATTVVALRPLGMKLHMVPAFSWSMLVAAVFWMFAMAVLLGNLVILYVRFRYLGGDPAAGSEAAQTIQPGMWAELQWAFTGPQAFAWSIPLLGVAAETVPVAARVRQRNYTLMLGAIAFYGLLTFAAYAQPAFQQGSLSVVEQAVYVGQSFAMIVPVFLILGGLADTIRLGLRNVGTPRTWFLVPLLGVLVLLIGLAVTAVRAIDEVALVGTSVDAASLHLAVGVGLLGAVGALAFWVPKLQGRALTPIIALGGLAIAGGAVVAGLADFGSGLLDQPLFVAPGTEVRDGVEALNIVALVGAVLLFVGLLAVILDLALAAARGTADDAPDDPWHGHTLEWSTTSPPPEHNFAEPVALVRSERPLLDEAEADDADDSDAGEEA